MTALLLSKYELWNALSVCPETDGCGLVVKTDGIKQLEKLLNDNMKNGYSVAIDLRTEEQ
jgi:hypothetical protein